MPKRQVQEVGLHEYITMHHTCPYQYYTHTAVLTLVGQGTGQVTTSPCSPKQVGLYHEVPHLSLLHTHSISDPSQGTGQMVTPVQTTGRPTHNASITVPEHYTAVLTNINKGIGQAW